ncbi:MAG: DNA-directed RNA polymerase subunit beta' [Candidatus Poribacteria bacterium]|nr:DNA-directed RNA polymerase subunit beta' [Candidatus Poribacteria bacterium]
MNTAFDSISIKIASPDQIKDEAKQTSCRRRNPSQATDGPFICPEKGTCSCGEVKKAETINYRSFRPEPEGLFCEAIFGPQKDWECNCGKYKRIKHKGMICDRCGVEITQQRVRRDRLGYIQLAAPVSHIWYFKGIPSRIGTFCELSSRDVERVLYFEGFIVVEVTDPDCPLEPGQVLTEIEYIEHSNKYWGGFRAGTGAEVIREILSGIDLEEEKKKLTEALEETTSHQKKLKIAKQLKQMADFAEVGQRPEWMILDVIPVIPPDLRPLVPLEGGRFATSDLNDLYRRVINRNNRLRKLIQLRSPEVILRNEKRMLQEAVDAFFDNGRHGRRVTGPGNRPLKSLADVLKGKIGRFRQNLLGKRVDYSGRSVIVVGPELGLHQCGIPKRMAVELFKPFIIERLQAYGYTQTIKRAKHIAEHVDSNSPVWEVVEEVIADHPVLLNRPPTLHRLGIQAFLPVLVEGKSIRIPPLVCKAFNADFDGDQMAVHVPLTVEAQAEAKLLMLSSHNILKPSHGDPVTVPELDMVLGPSFLTKVLPEHAADAALLHDAYTTRDPAAFEALREKSWFHRHYAHPEEVLTAHAAGQLKLHDSIQLFCALNGNGKTTEPILTTVGRVIFNEVLPSELEWEDEHSQQHIPFFNAEAGGRQLSALIHRCFNELGTRATTEVLEKVQKLAFEYATLSGISPGIMDYITPDNRDKLVNDAQTQIDSILEGVATTEREEHENEQIRIWLKAITEVENEMFNTLPELETSLVERGDPRKIHPYVNPDGSEISDRKVEGFSPVHIMADSGARARKNPFTQISAVIGLKAKQSGEILIPPITSSYREGLDVLDYFNSTYGSRKGLVDTAMKTAASGYLTRKLVDVAQDVRVTVEDCGTLNNIQKFATEGGELAFKISGRTAAEDIVTPENGDVLVPAGTIISTQHAEKIDELDVRVVKVRSVLTCQADEGVCAKCYGNDLTTNDLVNVGEAVGIIAAQSIGEPGTQLTMRTFHTGGAVEEVAEVRQRRILSKANGTVHFRDFQPGRTVEKEGGLWIAIENRANLDGPAYKVQQVNHPHCQLREGELLSEKQYMENAERYKGFDTKTWLYEVTEVLDDDCNLRVGQRLSQAEYVKAQMEYGFQRFVTPKYRVTQVQHPKLSLTAGTELTEEEIEQLKADTRQGIEGEWHYLDAETGERIAVENLTATQGNASAEPTDDAENEASDADTANASGRDASFNRVYCITEIDKKTSKDFGFKVGDEVEPEKIAPLLNPFEVDTKPVYVVNTEVGEFAVGQTLTAREYEDARTEYQQLERAFKVEKQDVERHYVTAVYHSECPLEVDEELSGQALTQARRRFTGFDAQKLRHRITQVHHPDCPLKPGDLISESEVKQFGESYPGFITSQRTNTVGSFEVERLYRVTAVNHPDCPLEVGELLTQKESSANRRQYKGLEVSRHYEVTQIDDGTTALSVGQRLTEIEYKAHRKTDAALPDKVTSLYHVVSVHHPELKLEVDTELSDKEYRTYHRQFKGFDAELVYRVVDDQRDIDTQLEPGTILPSKEYRALDKANEQVTHTVTEVHHPNCPYVVDDELSSEDYENARAKFPGFEMDELALRMRIEVETADGTRVSHVIPADYSFSLEEGDSMRKGDTLAELHERTKNDDIVAGIPRVTELFEARRPKREVAAQIAEIEGYVQSAGTKSGIPAYRIEHEGYQSRLYQIPDEKRRVAEGDWVNAGEPLTDGYLNPHDILRIGRTTIEGVSVEGEEAVWSYLVDEVQKVYPNGTINDKHVETIVRQMLTKIRITDPGDTNFYPNDEVQRRQFERINSEIVENGGIPATGEPILQSISKASLSTDSFISAASFQQTTKVLTDAAVGGQTDRLFGLKENVILGRLIPAGSGFSGFQNLDVSPLESEISETGDDD